MKTWFRNRWARICAFASFLVTGLAGIPYDFGAISTYVPPAAKLYVLLGGAALFGFFQIIQSNKPKPLPEQIIHIHHYYEKEKI